MSVLEHIRNLKINGPMLFISNFEIIHPLFNLLINHQMNPVLFESVDQYISQLFHDEDDCVKATEQSIIESGIPQISISPNQGKFLQLLAKLCNAKKILEIGTLGGYSTIWIARALPKDGKLITLEIDQDRKSTRLNSSHRCISYAVFCLKKKNTTSE